MSKKEYDTLPKMEFTEKGKGCGTKKGVACDYSGTPGTDHGSLPLAALLGAAGGEAGTPACATKKTGTALDFKKEL